MATETIRPNAYTDGTNWVYTNAGYYQDVSDQSDTDYINITGNEDSYITFQFPTPSLVEDGDTINSVQLRLTTRVRNEGGAGEKIDVLSTADGWVNSRLDFNNHGPPSDTFAWQNGTAETTMPQGGAWTWAGLLALECRILIDTLGATEDFDSSQIEFVIDYTEAGGTDHTKEVWDYITDLADSIINTIGKIVKDTASFADSTIIDVDKVIKDTLAIAESIKKDPSKVTSDQLSFLESTVLDINKIVKDDVPFTDSILVDATSLFKDVIFTFSTTSALVHHHLYLTYGGAESEIAGDGTRGGDHRVEISES
jgi:hypothetical protein